MRTETPTSYAEAAQILGDASRRGEGIRIRGGGTKPGWGAAGLGHGLELRTGGLSGVVEHDAADLTAVVRGGTRLAEAQEVFSAHGQMLALDPPLGPGERATVGGVVATGDSGPLRHGYKGPRDLLLGIRLGLSDGSVVRSGSKVIKNVAGYDLAKLACGSLGTVGLILEVVVRLHPIPSRTVTARGRSGDPETIEAGVLAVSHAPLQPDCLDVGWEEGRGSVLVRFGGAAPEVLAGRAARLLEGEGLETDLEDDDRALWEAQRAGQRAEEGGAVVRVSALQAAWARILAEATRTGAGVVGRGALGLAWLRLPSGDPDRLGRTVEALREGLAPFPVVVVEAPAEVGRRVDPWGPIGEDALALMRSVKARFDPEAVLNPGVFVEGI